MSDYLKEFQPPQRLLMGPGPSDVHPRVLQAMAKPILGHLDPDFLRGMDDVREMLRIVFQTSNTMTLPISATGTAGMEAAICNVVEPGDTVVIAINGYFGNRMARYSFPVRGRGAHRDFPVGHARRPRPVGFGR